MRSLITVASDMTKATSRELTRFCVFPNVLSSIPPTVSAWGWDVHIFVLLLFMCACCIRYAKKSTLAEVLQRRAQEKREKEVEDHALLEECVCVPFLSSRLFLRCDVCVVGPAC